MWQTYTRVTSDNSILLLFSEKEIFWKLRMACFSPLSRIQIEAAENNNEKAFLQNFAYTWFIDGAAEVLTCTCLWYARCDEGNISQRCTDAIKKSKRKIVENWFVVKPFDKFDSVYGSKGIYFQNTIAYFTAPRTSALVPLWEVSTAEECKHLSLCYVPRFTRLTYCSYMKPWSSGKPQFLKMMATAEWYFFAYNHLWTTYF